MKRWFESKCCRQLSEYLPVEEIAKYWRKHCHEILPHLYSHKSKENIEMNKSKA